MKKILLTLLLLSLPYSSFASLDFYLSSERLPYWKDVWTSASFPDSWSSQIQVDRYFYKEDFPTSYRKSSEEIHALINDLFSSLSPTEQQDRYNSLIDFDKQDLSQYIAIAISPNTDTDIIDKQNNNFLLSPFESTFQSCWINLSTRRSIAKIFIEEIYNNNFSDIDALEYSDIRFGDCIIPFPDIRRWANVIGDSFPSNKLIAKSLWSNPLRFWALEDSVSLFSLSGIDISWSYQWVQENNILDLQSIRIEEDSTLPKEPGKEKILYVHQNHLINPFVDSIITGDSTTGYSVGWQVYDANHPLFIQRSDSEEKRTLSAWKEITPWIYLKTVFQEDTFDLVDGVYIPKQAVGVTSYYAVIYNYDTSPPVCPLTLFSNESTGSESFIFPTYPWFQDTKYGYFTCSDEESGCFCDSSIPGCFIKNDVVLSIPQEIPHNGSFEYTFKNFAWLSQSCNSPIEQRLFYDKISPDARLTLPGIPESSLIREYVSNNGVLYDGVQIAKKRFYSIQNKISFKADEALNIQIQIYDPYDNTKTQEWVSWLSWYNLSISKFENNNWVQKINDSQVFGNYNILWDISVEDSFTLDFQNFTWIQDIFTQIGKYQVSLNFWDSAKNESQIVFYFDITPADIDVDTSSLEVIERNTRYADNTSSYVYTLSLKDKYLNPIAWKNIINIEQSCFSAINCSEIRLDMSWSSPSWEQALDIYDISPVSDSNGKIQFSIVSRAPGIFTELFTVQFSDLSALRFSGQNNTFLVPLLGILEAKVSSLWVSDTLPINTLSDYRVRINDVNNLWYIWHLSDFKDFIKARHPDTDFILSWPLINQADGVYFSGTFISNLSKAEKHKTLLEIVDNSLSGIIVWYTLDGKIVKYRLSYNNTPDIPLQLWNTGELKNPVKIIGKLQWVWNTQNLSERQNFTNINSNALRNIFRKNIWKNISNRKSGTTVWGVKYIDKTWDFDKLYILEPNPDFETLIVRNGNIHIQSDFNISWKSIGLVSIIDGGYNKQNGFEKIGNIYIEPEIKTINAFIYADGALVSTQAWIPISWDVTTRNTNLQKQLFINGALFTRNTLAGGRELGGEYILPGWEKTSNQSLATQYDLYYTRRGNNGCVKDTYGFCNIPEYLIIEYDSQIQSSPPKLFESQ